MSLAAIRAALETALDDMTPALATAWENAAYSPVEGTPYQRAFLIPAPPENVEALGGTFFDRGLFQVSLAYPLDGGTAAATARAEMLRTTFRRGATFTSGDTRVVVDRTPEIMPAMAEPDRWVVPVRVRYFAQGD